MWKSIAATVGILALTVPAFADTHVSYVDEAGKPASQLYVKDGKVRLESSGGVMLYDAAAASFTMIDTEEKSYMVMDAATMEKMAARAAQMQQRMAPQMGQMQAQMQAQMEHMSPEQRAGMEEMMAGLAAHGAKPSAMQAPQVEIKELGSKRKVAGYGCKDIQMVVQGTVAARMCVADPGSLDIPAADGATLKAMHEGVQKMAAMGPGASVPDIMPRGLALSYEPEAMMADEDNRPEVLKGISTGGLKADLFAPPAGYTRREMPDMGDME